MARSKSSDAESKADPSALLGFESELQLAFDQEVRARLDADGKRQAPVAKGYSGHCSLSPARSASPTITPFGKGSPQLSRGAALVGPSGYLNCSSPSGITRGYTEQ